MKEKSSCVGGDIKNLHFRGVKKRPSGRYAAEIKTPGRDRSSMWLGTFDTAEEAALAYAEAARKYRGDMANTNFPLPEKITSHGHCKNRVKIKDDGPGKIAVETRGYSNARFWKTKGKISIVSPCYIEKSKESGFGEDVKKVQYRGIRKRSSGNYAAEIWSSTITNKRKWLGTFGTAEEAALAYDAAAREYHGDKAITNFPLPGEITIPGRSSLVGPSHICDNKTMHMEEPNDPSLDFVAYGNDSRPMNIVCCERENKSEFNQKAHEKAKKTQLLSENVEDDKSMVSKNSKSVYDFENFEIVVSGSTVDHELPYEIRKKYFDLCSNHKSVLHGGFLKGISAKLGVEIISETTKISELIRDCELKTCEDNLETWDKILAGFEMLGMDVFFIRARINRLLGLLQESKLVDIKEREINCWFREEAKDSW